MFFYNLEEFFCLKLFFHKSFPFQYDRRWLGLDIGNYGYHWWILTNEKHEPTTPHAYFAMGYEGQYIIVVPKYEMVVIFTSSMPNQTFLPLTLFKRNLFETFR